MTLQWDLPYGLRRMPVFARNVVASSQPLAAQAGLQMLRQGGNAVDAALAAAITLTVVEPVSSGYGSDGFAMVWDGAKLSGLNATGRSPAAATLDRYSGMDAMPEFGWGSVTVPGVVSGWVALSKRFGALPFGSLFKPAIGYARDGFLVTPTVARQWRGVRALYKQYPDIHQLYYPEGEAPEAGDLVKLPYHAMTLEAIAESDGEDFYRGGLARAIAKYSEESGGLLRFADLADHSADWVEPLSIRYRDVDVHELPPNGQGLAALIALGVLNRFESPELAEDSAESLHLQIEAMKLGFAEVYSHVSDLQTMRFDPEVLLDQAFLAKRASTINPKEAQYPTSALPFDGGTTYLATADPSGMMVSYIQSSGRGFGAGLVVPHTGIPLQCRARSFSLDENHPNCIGPRKRPFHTNIPAFATREGKPVASFGVMGWNTQPQGHVQLMVRLIDQHRNPQAALEAPRWRLGLEEPVVLLEDGFKPETVNGLERLGHKIVPTEKFSSANSANTPFGSALAFGAGQVILRLEDGYIGVSDPRRDGQAVGF
jgi:gamma-glutamyltranspeptidase/glutathione hydrolase